MVSEPAIAIPKRRRRGVLIHTNIGADTRTADVQPDDFDRLAAHDVDVHLETLDVDDAFMDIGDYRVRIFAERGPWPWSRPRLRIAASYEPETMART